MILILCDGVRSPAAFQIVGAILRVFHRPDLVVQVIVIASQLSRTHAIYEWFDALAIYRYPGNVSLLDVGVEVELLAAAVTTIHQRYDVQE